MKTKSIEVRMDRALRHIFKIKRTAEPKKIRMLHSAFSRVRKLKHFAQGVKYAAKLTRGVLSGYDGLQVQFNGDWEFVAFESTTSRKVDGSYTGGTDFEMVTNPYYVCVVWQNKSHTPLPVMLDDGDDGYRVQKIIVALFVFLWNHTSFCPESWRATVMDCTYYEQQWPAGGLVPG